MEPFAVQGYEMAPLQKRLWKRLKGAPLPVVQGCFSVNGQMDVSKLMLALRSVARRQEILRTTFRCLPSMELPIQVVGAGEAIDFRLVALAAADEQHGAPHVAQEDRVRPFDLEQGPVLRATLVTLGTGRSRLVLTAPALCADANSLGYLFEEIAAAYDRSAAGSGEELIQYSQYAAWHNELLGSEDAGPGLEYWARNARHSGSAPALPFTPYGLTGHGRDSLTIDVELEASRRLDQLASAVGVGAADVLLGCWAAWLSRVTGEPAVTVSVKADARTFAELEDAVGLYATWLPVRVQVNTAKAFSYLVSHVAEATGEATGWLEYYGASDEEVPATAAFEYLPYRDRFTHQGLEWCVDRLEDDQPSHPFALTAERRGAGLRLVLTFDTGLLPSAYAESALASFGAMVNSCARASDHLLGTLPMLSAAQHHEAVVAFNHTEAAFPDEQCLHHLFERRVAETPDAVALICEDQKMTYAELNDRANGLALVLRGMGIGPEAICAVCMDRSTELVLALLGVLKAGAAYLPVDPGYPEQRVAYLLDDSNARVLLTSSAYAERFAGGALPLVCVDRLDPAAHAANPDTGVQPDHLAYVIYTSGSTGRPKGVMVAHRGVVNYVTWAAKAYAVANGTGALLSSPIGFDLTVTSLFTPLIAGRAVVVVPEGDNSEGLATALQRHNDLSLVKITPAHLTLLADQLPEGSELLRLGALVVGGESLQAEALASWGRHAPGTPVFNEYGPTETVVGCCVYRTLPGEMQAGSVPIGRPIANMQLYLLDEWMQPLPPGIPGEIYIGGAGVARGYLNRPDLTAERFMPSPFSAEPGARLYRTGDLARFLPDGNLEYLGRLDHQVKIRGFRIELGEIESALLEHPNIREAVVLVKEAVQDDKYLLAFLVPKQESLPAVDDLRLFLRRSLPEHMLPTAFVALPVMPLTTNGKVDRRALQAMDHRPAAESAAYISPRTPTEATLAEIWGEVLERDQIGVSDNFFAIGGHSLAAMRILARVNRAFDVKVAWRELLDKPTVAALAELVEAKVLEEAEALGLTEMLDELEGLSEEEAQARLRALEHLPESDS